MTRRIPIPTIVLTLALAALAGTPLIVRPASEAAAEGAQRLIIIPPHNQQIRWEFAHAFSEWHGAKYARPSSSISAAREARARFASS